MSLTRYFRGIFFGPDGPTGTKFSKQNKPTKQRFKELFDSIAFIKESDDTATEAEQGLTKLQTDTEAKDRSIPSGSFAKTVRAHQLPKLEVSTGAETSDTDGASVSGRGIRITSIKKTIGAFFRRNYRIENTMTITSCDADITVTEPTSGNYVICSNISAGPTGPTGPTGDNAEIAIATKNTISIICDCELTADVTYLPATTWLRVNQGGVYIDLTAYLGSFVIISAPAALTLGALALDPGDNTKVIVSITAVANGFTSGEIEINLPGTNPLNTHTWKIPVHSVAPGCNGEQLEWQGALAVAPANPENLWWYTSSLTGSSYWYDGVTASWKLMNQGSGFRGPTDTTTIVAAGGSYPITATDAPVQIIQGNNVTLVANLEFVDSGAFADGQSFIFIFKAKTWLDGNTFTVFGETITDAMALQGFIVQAVYDGTANVWRTGNFRLEKPSAWVDLLGCGHYNGPTVPKYRVEGKQVFLDGVLVIPLDDGVGNVVSYTSEKDYATTLQVGPFAGADGVTINGEENLEWFLGASIFDEPAYHPEKAQLFDTIAYRRVLTSQADTYATYLANVTISISTGGILKIHTIREIEKADSVDPGVAVSLTGHLPLRKISSNVTSGDNVLDYSSINGGGTMDGIAGFPATQSYVFDTQNITHQVTLDAAKASELGGFFIVLNHSFLIE